MSDSDMVTITIPASEAENITRLDPKAYGGPSGIPTAMRACGDVLAARKSKYERWREDLQLPWR